MKFTGIGKQKAPWGLQTPEMKSFPGKRGPKPPIFLSGKENMVKYSKILMILVGYFSKARELGFRFGISFA
jgi:hypothetical protein